MRLDPWTLAAIIGMALATYACRGGGYWLFRQIKPTPLLRAVMAHIPGTLFVSFVVPALVAGGTQPVVGAAATLVTMVATRSLSLAILAGTAAAWGVWGLG
ncbi:AzlD family protein [Limobrevibacterium gyesilva]|uniref:AzlD domain-containing protein n=1 Tax=Limobrevibacterium gyesilva TaxID=2991712 RepID=A0AA42CCH6_9PROT|nr:AzlD domain-containing protein [Limobrevibacterium gyesilva]MCW3473373.1 AzlD domain-containing protein [Limobrevibacterium gyesilva]